MKKFITFVFITLSTVVFGQTANEVEMVGLVNQVRTNPKSFVPVVEDYIKTLESGKTTIVRNGIKMTVTKKVDPQLIVEAKALVKFLNTVKPVGAVEVSSVLYPIAKAHAMFLDSTKQVSHTGPNGQTLSDRTKGTGLKCGENCTTGADAKSAIILFLIDFKATEKGHRNNIFNPSYTKIAVANSGAYWVQDFAF